MHLEFFLEEQSMQNTIESILKRIAPDEVTWRCHPYHGKKNLLRRLPQVLRGYQTWLPDDYRLIIVVDQDEDDCYELKQKIMTWCNENGLSEQSLIRIVVMMLESWFLGDMEALRQAFPKLNPTLAQKSKYRNPEELRLPSQDLDDELQKLGYGGYRKLEHSTQIAPHLMLDGSNRAHSFNVFIEGINRLFDNLI